MTRSDDTVTIRWYGDTPRQLQISHGLHRPLILLPAPAVEWIPETTRGLLACTDCTHRFVLVDMPGGSVGIQRVPDSEEAGHDAE